MQHPADTAPARQLLPALLGLRGLAAVAVLLFHLHHLVALPLPPRCGFIGTHFGLGVKLFFVLSGFSLCHSTIHSMGRPTWIRDYLLKRFFRIAPLFYAMLAVWVAYFWRHGSVPDIADVLLNLTFTFNFVPGRHESLVAAGWTIGVEMIFYCLLPVLLATIRGLRGAVVCLALAAAVSGAGRAALVRGGDVLAGYANLSFIASLVVFMAGIAAYHLWRALPAGRRPIAIVAAITLGLAAVLVSPLQLRLLGPWRPYMTLWGLCFACLTVWQAAAPARFLAARPMQFLGDRSYSIYLLHPLLIAVLKNPILRVHTGMTDILGEWAFLGTGCLVTVLVTAVATCTHAWVELPGIRAGGRLIASLSGQAVAPPPTGVGPAFRPRAGVLADPRWSWLAVVLALGMLGVSGSVAIRYRDQPLVDIHAFRQTQTALTAEWLLREGWRLDYQTPVAGAPWSIPFEFPIYQSIVAAIVAVSGWGLTATGRVVSWLFLAACGWPAWQLARRLRLPRAVPWVFCALLWSAPLSIYWGRTFMIETSALFFTLACLPWWLDVVRSRGGWWSRGLFVATAACGVLQKSTTTGPVLIALLVVAGVMFCGGAGRRFRAGASWGAALVLAVLAIGAAWIAHSDAVKASNPLGRLLTSSSLSKHNFGPLALRLDPKTWRTVVWERGVCENAGGLLTVAALAACLCWPGRHRGTARWRQQAALVAVCLVLYLVPILLFTNLHLMHEYYQVACLAFLLAAVAISIGGWLPRVTGVAAIAPLAVVPFLLANVATYRASYRIVVKRPPELQDPLSVGRYRLGLWLRDATPAGSGLVVFGQDYSSELPFHAGRKAFVCPIWFPAITDVWERPGASLGGLTLGAIVVAPQPGVAPSAEDVRSRVAGGGWRHEIVEGYDVLLPDATQPAVRPDEPPTDPGDPTTDPR